MNNKIAYVFDLDNVIIKSDLLLPELDILYSKGFPEIEQGMLTECYNNYKNEHQKKVHMRNIIMELAKKQGISEEQIVEFLTFYRGLDIAHLLMDPDHSLMKVLGLENVFILTKGDSEFQQWKIDAAKLTAEFSGTDHIRIVEEKTGDIYSHEVQNLLAKGYEQIVFINDSKTELRDSFVAGPEGKTLCILMHYGKHADEAGPEGFTAYEEVHNFDELSRLLLPQTMLEGQYSRPRGELK